MCEQTEGNEINVNGKKIIEVGKVNTFAWPVKFADGSYGILYENSTGKLGEWVPDDELAAEAIRQSQGMPDVQRGIGSDVLHVRGTDRKGPYLVKLFYNEKKDFYERVDEIYRQ